MYGLREGLRTNAAVFRNPSVLSLGDARTALLALHTNPNYLVASPVSVLHPYACGD
jgi:hypothetical protein